MHIAYCTRSDSFARDRLRNKRTSYLYPGSGWISQLYREVGAYGFDMSSGDVALENVANGKWSAKDVWVIQDMDSGIGEELLQLGAFPFLLVCLEAPLYAPYFYDRLDRLASSFKFRYGFGLRDMEHPETSVKDHFRFPSYYVDDIKPLNQNPSWSERRPMVLVAANKFKSPLPFFPFKSDARELIRQMKWLVWQGRSAAYRQSLRSCLHEDRLAAIEYFASVGSMDLYGKGWDDMRGIPWQWARRLQKQSGIHYRGVCASKLDVLGAYKFSLCYENMSMHGYITEKIVDCFVAGTVPLYRGATDVENYIPSGSYISGEGGDYANIHARMSSMKEEEAIRMIECGRSYLKTEAGRNHSYEGFAAHVLELTLLC